MTTTCAFRCDAVYPASRRKRRLLGDVELTRARVLPTRIIRQHMPLQAGSRLGPYEILSLAWTRDGTAVIYDATGPTFELRLLARDSRRQSCARAHRNRGQSRRDASCRAIARSAGVHTHIARR
jgi:hypothetical protein